MYVRTYIFDFAETDFNQLINYHRYLSLYFPIVYRKIILIEEILLLAMNLILESASYI
jgi:hypothetical protein